MVILMSDIEIMAKKWSEDFETRWRQITEDVKNQLWQQSKSFTVGLLETNQSEDRFVGRAVKPRKDYIEIRVKSMRVPFKIIGTRTYYGTVHSFISLNNIASANGKATFSVVTTPTDLQNLDRTNLFNVITKDILLLGPIPYHGGDINLEAGVFSVLSDNLLAPFLKIIEDVSKTAGVSIINQALPFIGPIEDAIYHLIGYSSNNKLEVGINMPLMDGQINEGYLVVVAASGGKGYLSQLRLQNDGRLFNRTEEITNIPYMVLTIRAKERRGSYEDIPKIRESVTKLYNSFETGDHDIIMRFFNDFRNVVNGSPELLPLDASMIIDETYQEKVKPVLDGIQKSPKPATKGKAKPKNYEDEAVAFLKSLSLK
jgi:hypothetical protein